MVLDKTFAANRIAKEATKAAEEALQIAEEAVKAANDAMKVVHNMRELAELSQKKPEVSQVPKATAKFTQPITVKEKNPAGGNGWIIWFLAWILFAIFVTK